MEVDAGCWASTHFDPDLNIKFNGTTVEQDHVFTTAPNKPSRDIIGSWINERGFVKSRITIYRRDGVVFIEDLYLDGGQSETEMIEKSSRRGKRFDYKTDWDRRRGCYYLIDGNGDLQYWDYQDGYFRTDRKVKGNVLLDDCKIVPAVVPAVEQERTLETATDNPSRSGEERVRKSTISERRIGKDGSGVEVAERLQPRIEKLEGQLDEIQSRLAVSEIQRDAAIRQVEDAKRQMAEVMHQAAIDRRQAADEFAAIREQADREKDGIRQESITDMAEIRRQCKENTDAIRNTTSTQVEAARSELSTVRKQFEAYKTRMNRAESELKQYMESEAAERQLAIHYYMQGIGYLGKQDYPKANEELHCRH